MPKRDAPAATTAPANASGEEPARGKPRRSSSSPASATAAVASTSPAPSPPALRNEYAGWRVPADGEGVPRIRFRGHFTPSTFFDAYVKTRRPVVLLDPEGPDDSWQGQRWDTAYLRRVAGDRMVRVEHRDGDDGCFGRGCHSSMRFSAFLDILDAAAVAQSAGAGGSAGGDASAAARRVYLTTQDLGQDADGRPQLHSAPCTQLLRAGDFPQQPMVLDSLIPMNYNLWIGSTTGAAAPSSSGLHHDFHDNLYVLLRGQKTFRLYSPADAERMYTVGRIVRVHPNGRICYADDKRAPGGDGGEEADQASSRVEADGSNAQVGVRRSLQPCAFGG
jgi:hypothetical protein